MRRTAAAALVAITAIGCGSNSTNAMPPAPSGTIVSIAVNSSAPTLFLGATETFAAVATYTSGATQTLTGGAWTTDTPAVALVDSVGRVTTVTNGEATISVDYLGMHASKQVRVLPNYAGSWSGFYTIVSCTPTDGFAAKNLCDSFNIGQTRQYGLQLTQNADVVSGITIIGILGSTTASGTVNMDGSLTLTPPIFVGTVEIDLVWKLTCAQANAIGGTVTQTWTDLVTPGQMVIEGALQRPTKQ